MSVRSEVEKITATFAQAVTAKDFAALRPFYEEDARLPAPGAPYGERGRAAIVSAQQRMIVGGVQPLRPECVDLIDDAAIGSSKSGASL